MTNSTPPAGAFLADYNSATLNVMAQSAGLLQSKTKYNKEALLALLRQRYFTQARIQAALNQLHTDERAVLNRLQIRGRIRKRALQRELVAAGLVTALEPSSGNVQGPVYALRERPADVYNASTVFQDVIARLTRRGLVFSQVSESNQTGEGPKLTLHPADMIYIPAEVAAFLPDPSPLPTAHVWQPDRILHADLHLWLRELYIYWDFVRRNKIILTTNGYVAKKNLKEINQQLPHPTQQLDQAKTERAALELYQLRLLLQALGLLEVKDNLLIAEQTNLLAGDNFWAQDLVSQLEKIFAAVSTGNLMVGIAPDLDRVAPNTELAARLLLEAAGDNATQWLPLSELHAEIRSLNASFLYTVYRYYYEYSYMRVGNEYLSGGTAVKSRLEREELDFLRSVLERLWLRCGVVELGIEAPSAATWSWLRLTPMGAAFVARRREVNGFPATAPIATAPTATASPAPAAVELPGWVADEEQGKVVLQPNFQLLAIGPVTIKTLARIGCFAERKKAGVGVFEYALTRNSVYQGSQQGWRVDAVVDFLREVTGADLPQNVLRSLQEWGAHQERIVFHNDALLLQSADEQTLDELLAHPSLQPMMRRRLGPEVAILTRTNSAQAIAALFAAGVLPVVSDERAEAADHSVEITADGEVRVLHAVPHVQAHRRLAAVAEQDAAGGWRISEQLVARRTGDRRSVAELLADLDRLQRGALPDTLVAAIKRWGGYYGAVEAEKVVLMEFHDRVAYTEALAHPRLAPLLTPFPAGERLLAIAPADRLAEVTAVLADLGAHVGKHVLATTAG